MYKEIPVQNKLISRKFEQIEDHRHQ